MEDMDQFDAVFGSDPDLAYNNQTIDHILRNRRSLENELFFDRLLKALGINQASKLYPPRSNQDLRSLHERIVTSASPDHHKQSLIYYILKDVPARTHSAESFASNGFLPTKYQIFIDGIWCLDRLMFERALEYLTEPTLTPTFPEEILYTLCQHAPDNNPTLPLAYYHTICPTITSNMVLDVFFNTMCCASVTEAFYFSRSHGQLIHHQLFEKLVNFVHADTAGEIRAGRGVEMISLPFDETEEEWFEKYLVEGKGRSLFGAKDTVMMRKIATGRSHEAMDFGANMSGRKVNGMNWESLKDALQQSSGQKAASRSTITS